MGRKAKKILDNFCFSCEQMADKHVLHQFNILYLFTHPHSHTHTKLPT